MAWENRKGVGRYYTRSRRVGGRVRRVYIGAGLLGELAAAQDELRRVLKGLVRLREEESIRERMDPIRKISDEVAEIHAACEKSLGEYLKGLGYHYTRGEWRRKRGES